MTTNSERHIYFYSLIPNFIETLRQENDIVVFSVIKSIFLRLTKRHDKSKSILGTAIMTDKNQETIINLDDEKIWLELSQDEGIIKNNGESEAESQLSHLTIYEKYRDRINLDSDFIHSSMKYSKKAIRIVVLIKTMDSFQMVSYNITDEVLEDNKTNVFILNMIACKIDTPKYFIQAAEIEKWTNKAVYEWCLKKKMDIDIVKKKCAILLIPDNTKDIDMITSEFITTYFVKK